MHRSAPSTLTRALRRAGVVLVSCLAVATLASCGGGTQSKKFEPQSFVVFGDELSLITSDGLAGVSANEGATYGAASFVSGSSGPYDCVDHYSWIMLAADALGFKFSNECAAWLSDAVNLKTAVMLANDPGDVDVTNDTSVDLAVTNAGVDAILAKINANLDKVDGQTLVSVNAGRADIVKAYRQFLAAPSNLEVIRLALKAKGQAFAEGLRPLVNKGARVLLVLSPGLSESPLVKSSPSGDLVRNKAAMLALGKAFNEGAELRAGAIYTGQQLGLIRLDQAVEAMVSNVQVFGTTSNSFGLVNIDAAGCASPATTAPLCLDSALTAAPTSGNADGSDNTYLWSDATHVSNGFYIRQTFANLVLARIANQPF
ncbi:MAG: hypothetical protein ACK4F8_10400 [Aquabacterium sp.]